MHACICIACSWLCSNRSGGGGGAAVVLMAARREDTTTRLMETENATAGKINHCSSNRLLLTRHHNIW